MSPGLFLDKNGVTQNVYQLAEKAVLEFVQGDYADNTADSGWAFAYAWSQADSLEVPETCNRWRQHELRGRFLNAFMSEYFDFRDRRARQDVCARLLRHEKGTNENA